MATNTQMLEAAKVVDPAGLTPDQVNAINQLSAVEVVALMALRSKVGDFSGQPRPFIL
jgi:hypothetical protein